MLPPQAWEAVWLSARVAACAALLCLPLGIATAWILEHKRFRGRFLLDVAVQLPMVLPPVVPGYLLLLLLGTQGPLGAFLQREFRIVVAFTWQGAVIASAVMAFPLMVQPIRLAFRLIDARIEKAAATLGARPSVVFWTISLPLAVPGVLAGTLLCFSRSLGEFGATMAFVGNIPGETRTLPLAIYSFMQMRDGESAALRLMLLSLLLAGAALLACQALGRYAERRLGYRDHRRDDA